MAWITSVPFSVGPMLSTALKVSDIIKPIPESCVSSIIKKMKPH